MAQGRPAGQGTARGLLIAAFLAVILGGSWATARWISSDQGETATGTAAAGTTPVATATAMPSATAPEPSQSPSAGPTESSGPTPSAATIPQARVLFASNSTALTPVAKRDLDRIVAYVKKSTTAIVIVQGHSDSVGSSVAKQRTAMDRAHAVEAYLSARGVPHDQLSHTGFSDSRPAASGTATPDPTQDRRVDVVVRDVAR